LSRSAGNVEWIRATIWKTKEAREKELMGVEPVMTAAGGYFVAVAAQKPPEKSEH
jgi:hypothetical protein